MRERGWGGRLFFVNKKAAFLMSKNINNKDLNYILSETTENIQRTNDFSNIHIFDSRFSKFTQSGHTTLLNSTLSPHSAC